MRCSEGRLGDPETVLDHIPGGRGHNGGRIAFGPDGMLYVTVGETRNLDLTQDLNSLAGKMLRMTPEAAYRETIRFPARLSILLVIAIAGTGMGRCRSAMGDGVRRRHLG